MRRTLMTCALAMASGGCAADGKDQGGVELSLPGVVLITPWLENSTCDQSPYGRAFRADIDTDPGDGPYLATFEARLDDPVAVGLPPGAFKFYLRGGWEADAPREPECEDYCACDGSVAFTLDPSEVLDLAVPVNCGYTCID